MREGHRPARVRNSIGWRERLGRLRGEPVRFDLRLYDAPLQSIAAREPALRALTDFELRQQAHAVRTSGPRAPCSEDLVAPVFALAREASRRVLGLRPYDEQVVAALAMDRGAVVDMQTGEGKTLAAVMPAAANVMRGRRSHVLTFNDYLARRDAEWMGPVYRMLGIEASCVQEAMSTAERRRAYAADVTYVTAKQAGFDHLRDLLALDAADLLHQPFQFALVDEADSLMIDEARVPLVIAGRFQRQEEAAPRLAALVASMSPDRHFAADEHGRSVELTDDGLAYAEGELACGPLHTEGNYRLLTQLNCALHARVLLRRDVEYIVRHGRILLIDEFTGRVVRDRQWPEGLQQALEAKEGIGPSEQGEILDSMTLQRFLRGYPHLCGMSGTARDAAAELHQVYGLPVVVIPPHRPLRRIDQADRLFSHRDAKEAAVVDEVRRVNAGGRPVLVGTLTVEESERLAARLRAAQIPCAVLNARNDETEAEIIARAGAPGAVTISTNMAGRGTDVRLGGPDERHRDRVAAVGGLYVIGTNRHESRRVDLQLRGRAGRQGDPGESIFLVSLEDDLPARYGLPDLVAGRWAPRRSEAPIDHPVLRREVARAQRIIEGQNFEIRQTLARYAAVVEEQQDLLKERRQALLTGRDLAEVWRRRPARRAPLVARVGERAVDRLERTTTLIEIDRAWREHLAFCAHLREGIHLVRLGGQDPLAKFSREAIEAYGDINRRVEQAVGAALDNIGVVGGELGLSNPEMQAPAATWTYLINDDPFRHQVGTMLTGPGGRSVAVFAAAMLMPLLILWGLVDRFGRRRRR